MEDALIPALEKYFPRNAQGERGRARYSELDIQIGNIEDDYDHYHLDFWTCPDYFDQIKKLEEKELAQWALKMKNHRQWKTD